MKETVIAEIKAGHKKLVLKRYVYTGMQKPFNMQFNISIEHASPSGGPTHTLAFHLTYEDTVKLINDLWIALGSTHTTKRRRK